MKEILVYIVQHLVDHPESIVVEEISQESGVLLRVTAHQEDIGKIIGKSGRIIRALRDLMKIIAAKHNTYVDVELEEQESKTSQKQNEQNEKSS